MKRFLVAGLALLSCGCAGQNTYVSYAPPAVAAERLPEGLPPLRLEPVKVGEIQYEGPIAGMDPKPGTDWSQVLFDAFAAELESLGWPKATGLPQARMRASLTRANARWRAGMFVRVDGGVSVLVELLEADGRKIWETRLSGSGEGESTGGGYAVVGNGIRVAWKGALQKAMGGLAPALLAERPWLLVGKTPAPVAAPAAPAAPAVAAPAAPPSPPRVRSDVDELPPARAPRKAHAVVVGIERYRESLPRADFAAGDARLAAEYFKRLGVPEANVAVLVDERATRGDFEKYFERWLPNRVEAGDEVYVYFSGHGAPNPAKGDAYLVPYDGDPTYIEQTGYPLAKLYAQLAKLPARSVTVAMDSCFSGAGGRSVLAKGARPLVSVVSGDVPAKVTVLSASAGDQISNSYQEKGHGLFTYFLLKGLKEKGADFKAAFDYLKPEVARVARREYNADQDPQWREGK